MRAVFLQGAIAAGPFVLLAGVIMLLLLGLIVFLIIALRKPGTPRITVSIFLLLATLGLIMLFRWLNTINFD